MARIKPNRQLPALGSWDDVDLALCELGEHQRAIGAVQAQMQQAIDDAKLAAKDASEPHQLRVAELTRQVQDFAEAHRAELGRRKSRTLTFGALGWRKSTRITIPRDAGKVAEIVRLLHAVGWHDCVTVAAPRINKDALRQRPAEEIVKLGCGVNIDDEFWLELATEALPDPEEVTPV